MSISTSLRRAAKLQEKIEGLREQLAGLLDKARAELAATPAEELPAVAGRGRPKMLKSGGGRGAAKVSVPASRLPAMRGRKPAKIDGRTKAARAAKASASTNARAKVSTRRSPLKGIKRASSPSGPLAPAVVQVLSAKKEPMNVRDILGGLTSNGYRFNSPEPKKNLAARIYRLKGVKQVSAGLFALA